MLSMIILLPDEHYHTHSGRLGLRSHGVCMCYTSVYELGFKSLGTTYGFDEDECSGGTWHVKNQILLLPKRQIAWRKI